MISELQLHTLRYTFAGDDYYSFTIYIFIHFPFLVKCVNYPWKSAEV